jgi:hypothetical protein
MTGHEVAAHLPSHFEAGLEPREVHLQEVPTLWHLEMMREAPAAEEATGEADLEAVREALLTVHPHADIGQAQAALDGEVKGYGVCGRTRRWSARGWGELRW